MTIKLLNIPLYFLTFVLTFDTFSQGWITINSTRGNFSFNSPEQPNSIDTLRTLFYSSSIDSTVSIQVYFIDSVELNSNDISELLTSVNGDTLRLFAKMLLVITKGNLVSIQDTIVQNVQGIDVGMNYSGPSYEEIYTFTRMFFRNNRFFTFAITGVNADLTALINYRNIFFNSIDLN